MPTGEAAVPASGARSAVHGVSANLRVLKRVWQEWFGGHVPGYGPAAMNPQQKPTPGELYLLHAEVEATKLAAQDVCPGEKATLRRALSPSRDPPWPAPRSVHCAPGPWPPTALRIASAASAANRSSSFATFATLQVLQLLQLKHQSCSI